MRGVNLISFRNLIESDFDIIFSWISDSELRKMTGTRGIPDLDSHNKWFQAKRRDYKNLNYVIVYDEKPVGLIGTNEINFNDKNANIYIYIGDSSYRKRGIGYIAIHNLLSILKEKYQCHKITASIRSYNLPSINLFRKCGFVCEGIQKDQILYEGSYYDLVLYGKLLD